MPVSGGTDSSVVPYSPLWVIYHFVTRDTISGGADGRGPEDLPGGRASDGDAQSLVPHVRGRQAKGTIAPGRFADMVVLPEDIMTVPAKRIEQMRVMMTMVGGKVVFRDPDFRKISTE